MHAAPLSSPEIMGADHTHYDQNCAWLGGLQCILILAKSPSESFTPEMELKLGFLSPQQ